MMRELEDEREMRLMVENEKHKILGEWNEMRKEVDIQSMKYEEI